MPKDSSNQPSSSDDNRQAGGTPSSERGLLGSVPWRALVLRTAFFRGLFKGYTNIALTIFSALVILWLVPPFLSFLIFDAAWSGGRDACAVSREGACWPFVYERFGAMMFGFIERSEYWRPIVVFALLFTGLGLLAYERTPKRRYIAFFMLFIFPIIVVILLLGGIWGLPEIRTDQWGGLLLTFIIAGSAMIFSLPLGILFALGRRSNMGFIRGACVFFIEFWRGVPLITVLFMATYMFPLFLPEGYNANQVVRCLVGFSLFAAAYMAEVIRGGLQALPEGQIEGAKALGLSYYRTTRHIVLPQALKIVIPGIVNTFIGLFKDTTLVLIVALLDFLNSVQISFTDPKWSLPTVAPTGYLFVGLVFFVCCFGMSLYSRFYERKYGIQQNR